MKIPNKFNRMGINGASKLPIPVQGLSFYAKLDKNSNTAETGQTLTQSNVQYTKFSGIDCAFIQSNGYISTISNLGLTGQGGFTLSYWSYPDPESVTTSNWVNWGAGFGMKTFQGGSGACSGTSWTNGNIRFSFTTWNNDIVSDPSLEFTNQNKMIHFAVVYTPPNPVKCYYNGNLFYTYQTYKTINIIDNIVRIGYSISSQYIANYRGYICGVRIYNRDLSDAEVYALSKQYNPK